MTTNPLVLIVATVATVASLSCGGNPGGPSGPSAAFIEGRWPGILTVTPEGGQPVTGPTTWTFEVMPQTSGFVFHVTIESSNPWLPLQIVTTTSLTPPGTPPSAVTSQSVYRSPRGCEGIFFSEGTATMRSITATLHGVDCGHVPFSGRVELAR